MATPVGGYYFKGKKIPGTTTVIGKCQDPSVLVSWGYRVGREHGILVGQGKPAPESQYDVSGRAADIGTVVHAMCEADVKGFDPHKARFKDASVERCFDSAFQDSVAAAYGAYEHWKTSSKLEIVASEVRLVSPTLLYGGTIDFIGRLNGQTILGDFKTSNGVYSSHLVQLAAYGKLWDENNPDNPITGGYHLLRFSKEHGDFGHHYYPELADAWEAFTLMRRIYDLETTLRRRAK
jgi:hypothetical protein